MQATKRFTKQPKNLTSNLHLMIAISQLFEYRNTVPGLSHLGMSDAVALISFYMTDRAANLAST